jgi:hypothetical protein
MAESPSHKFGQIIGSLLEEILLPVLQKFCAERGLYLDRHGDRVGVRSGKKVSWEDKYGNSHDLDFVIEKNGTATKRGRPVAFIEAAWRRYTKHSRNKAQEIQGAVLPIAERYEHDSPFLGAVLAGVFTRGSLDQLTSLKFNVVYLSYESVVAAFKDVNIDVRFDEDTPDVEFTKCIAKIESLSKQNHEQLKKHLLEANKAGFETFFAALRQKLDRLIQRIVILPLFGKSFEYKSIAEALKFISEYEESAGSGEFKKYEILVTFSNSDEIRGMFTNKDNATTFLNAVAAQ